MANAAHKAAFGGQVDDAEAVFDFFKRTEARTDKAATLKAQFLTWYNQSSWFDKNFSQSWYDQLRSRRNAFNIANAVTEADKAAVTRVLTTGMTAEEMQGKPRPKIDVKTGLVGTAIKNPPAVPQVGSKNPSFTRNLKKGLQGEDVKKWQTFLGLTPPTGYFDALTDTRTREYQKKNGLVVDGIVGKNTLSKAFPVAQAPFTPDVPAPPVVSAIKIPSSGGSAPAQPASRPTPSTPSKPPAAKKPAAATPAQKPAATQAPASVLPTANVLKGFSSIPLWAKITGALAGVGLVGGAVALGVKEHKRS